MCSTAGTDTLCLLKHWHAHHKSGTCSHLPTAACERTTLAACRSSSLGLCIACRRSRRSSLAELRLSPWLSALWLSEPWASSRGLAPLSSEGVRDVRASIWCEWGERWPVRASGSPQDVTSLGEACGKVGGEHPEMLYPVR